MYFIFSNPLDNQKRFGTARRDYSCDTDSFIEIKKHSSYPWVLGYRRKGFLYYVTNEYGTIDEDRVLSVHPTKKESWGELLTRCKNAEGKNLAEVITVIY
jgi:hypothetical protein